MAIYERSIIIENNYIGYQVFVSRPNDFEIGKVKKIYIYKHCSSNNKGNIMESLFGFTTLKEREVFCALLNVPGIGVKTAIAICANEINLLIGAIQNKDIELLNSFTGVTNKIATNIINHLFEHFEIDGNDQNSQINDLTKALSALGYASSDIQKSINFVNTFKEEKSLSELISMAIRHIGNSNAAGNS